MSAYYHSPMRDIFVGAICAVGVFLYLYKGYSNKENIALNTAGISAILVALFPMQWECGTECRPVTALGVFAVLFFLSIFYVCWFRATDTLPLVTDPSRRSYYQRIYRR